MSCGPLTITTRVSSNPHKDTKTPSIERSPSLLIIPSEMRVVPIAGMKLVRGSGMAIDNAQSSIMKAKIFSPGPQKMKDILGFMNFSIFLKAGEVFSTTRASVER